MEGVNNDPYDIWMAIRPQVVIVNNPMYFVNLRKETKSKLVQFRELFKNFTEKWFSHILLLFSLVLYGCFGAWIFMMIEGQAEKRYKEPIGYMINDFKREFWYQARVVKRDREAMFRLIELRMGEFERQLLANFKDGIDVQVEQAAWTFWDALFFCVTIFTTIGYGHITLKTDLGRGFTMIYAFIGIPLVLMVLTDLGKLFTRAIKATFLGIRRFLYAHGLRRVKRASRRVAPAQVFHGALNSMRKLSYIQIYKRRSKEGEEEKLEVDVSQEKGKKSNKKPKTVTIETPVITVNREPKNPKVTKIYKTPAIYPSERPAFPGQPPAVIISTNPTPPMTAYVESRPGSPVTPETPAPFQVDDEFNLPVSLALFILIVYIFIGAFIFKYTDNWRLFESFYFVYISMSTIGFGDYVPHDSVSMIASSIYLLFGLALTSMCINVIQERLSESFEKAKVSIGAQLGLNVNQILPTEHSSLGQEAKKSEVGKESNFELKANNIGQSLKARRERRRSSERSSGTPSDQANSEGPSDCASAVSTKSDSSSQKSNSSDNQRASKKASRSSSPMIKYSDL